MEPGRPAGDGAQAGSRRAPTAPPDPPPGESPQAAGGPLSEALTSVGDRWALLVVAALMDGPRRFNDLRREVAGIAPNVLSDRLRRLEARSLVVCAPYSRRPPRSVYELTAAGRELSGVLRLLADWGARHHGAQAAEPPRHAACGTPLEVRWYCPTCERAAEPGAEDELHHL